MRPNEGSPRSLKMKTKELTTKAVGLSMFRWLFTGRDTEALQRLEQRHALLKLRVEELSTKISTTAGAALLVQINELTAAVDQLQKSNRRELGKLWKAVSVPNNEIAAAVFPPVSTAVCENWGIAQREGPRSDAASCECDYCTERRKLREHVRAQLVPKTNAERKNAIEKGKH